MLPDRLAQLTPGSPPHRSQAAAKQDTAACNYATAQQLGLPGCDHLHSRAAQLPGCGRPASLELYSGYNMGTCVQPACLWLAGLSTDLKAWHTNANHRGRRGIGLDHDMVHQSAAVLAEAVSQQLSTNSIGCLKSHVWPTRFDCCSVDIQHLAIEHPYRSFTYIF